MSIALSVYVAAASGEWQRARAFMARVRSIGHRIAHDWTVDVEKYGANSDAGLSAQVQLTIALDCVRAVRDADKVVLLAPTPPRTTIGAWIELGIAIEGGVSTIVVGEVPSVFKRLALCVDTETDALFELGPAPEQEEVFDG